MNEEFSATLIGAAIGVIAGIFIQYVLNLVLERRTLKRQKNALLKELIYNKSLTDELLEELQSLRNAANGGVFNTYFGYFSYSKSLFAQANACASNGVLYDLFSKEEIRHAQKIVSKLSINHENWVNGEITRRRNVLINTPAQFDKAELINFINFLQKDLTELVKLIDELIAKIS